MSAPMSTLRPRTEAELSEAILRAAPLSIRGGGTRGIGFGADQQVLETGGLSGIRLYEPGALTLVVGAGTSMTERQRLAFEVPDMRGLMHREGASTIGGVVAANASGPRRLQVGACRDHLLGVRFVDGMGAIIKNGGRVMKNVTGYDLVKLMAGSHGTLGVLSEVSLKVQALPEAEATLSMTGLSATAAVAAMAVALGSPYDISGAAHLDLHGGETLIRLEGMAGSVAYRSAALQRLLGDEWRVLQDAGAAKWRAARDVSAFAAQEGAVWRVSVKPSDAPSVCPGVPALYDWGGGLLWLLMPDTSEAANALRARVGALGGHATRVRGAADVPAFHPEAAPVRALTTALRAKFDPRGIFNPGMMG
jgi:glycolate oxidase FAD binding subunit